MRLALTVLALCASLVSSVSLLEETNGTPPTYGWCTIHCDDNYKFLFTHYTVKIEGGCPQLSKSKYKSERAMSSWSEVSLRPVRWFRIEWPRSGY